MQSQLRLSPGSSRKSSLIRCLPDRSQGAWTFHPFCPLPLVVFRAPPLALESRCLSCRSPPAPRRSAPQGQEPSLSGARPCPLAHGRCSVSIYRTWRRVRKPRALLLSGGPWAGHVILPSVDTSPVSGAVALAGHAVLKSCEGITPDVCCAPTVCGCSVPGM